MEYYFKSIVIFYKIFVSIYKKIYINYDFKIHITFYYFYIFIHKIIEPKIS